MEGRPVNVVLAERNGDEPPNDQHVSTRGQEGQHDRDQRDGQQSLPVAQRDHNQERPQ